MNKKISLSVLSLATIGWIGCEQKDPIEAIKLECSYSSDFTLKNHKSGVDYICDCEVDISVGNFTIEPGVEISFTSSGALFIHDQATLKAAGTANEPIIMKDSEGSWKGIAIYSNKDLNQLSYAELHNAGNYTFGTVVAGFIHDYKAAIVVDGKAKLNNTTISGSKGYGVAYLSAASVTGFSGNTINNSESFPLFLAANQLNQTNLSNCSFSGNGKNYIAIYGQSSNSNVDNAVDFIQTQIPYYGLSSLNFVNVTRMAAGTHIVMANDKAIYISGNEYLKINGTAANPVIIRGETQAAGFWQGLLVNTNNPNNVFDYLNISDGGSSKLGVMPHKANIAVADMHPTQLTINNCTSTNYSGSQLSVSGTDGALTNNSPQITIISTH